jgi:hypothetical protein
MTGRDALENKTASVRCAHCGARFAPVRPLQRFCRPSCRVEHCRANGSAGQAQLPLDAYDLLETSFEEPSA